MKNEKLVNRGSLAACIAVIALSTAGCGPSAEEIRLKAAKEAKDKEAAQIEKFKETVSDQFSDPSATQFRKLTLIKGGKALCGEYNTKNRMGGYVGFRAFGVDTDGNTVILQKMTLTLARQDDETINKLLPSVLTAEGRSEAEYLIMDRIQRGKFKYWSECAR